MSSIDGYRKLPLRHISVRVPWHDNGWTGGVCKNPSNNTACLALDRIRESRDDVSEDNVAGQMLSDIPEKKWPACVAERGFFMSPFEITRVVQHPYLERGVSTHEHLLPTGFRMPIYSSAGVPFRWMLKKNAWDIAEQLELPCREEDEPELPFQTGWVQGYNNQKILLETFFSAVQPEKTLIFFYAKQTPLNEDGRRVLIGVGRALHVGEPVEYKRNSAAGLRCFIWDVAIQHSVRPDFNDGFILPYQELLDYAAKNPSINPADFVAYAPEDRRIEFSYATEHVTHDGAIGALLSCADALKKLSGVIEGNWDKQLKWIDQRLSELWKLRGPYPGLGAALCAFGVEHGNFLAYDLSSHLGVNEDPWPLVDNVFKNPRQLPAELASKLGKTICAKWAKLPEERRALLKLISRFEVVIEQATRFYVDEERTKAGINCSDRQLLENPYLIFEKDRYSLEPVSVMTVDRGMFPVKAVREAHPLPAPSILDDATDPRRVRAIIVNTLEEAAAKGHTLLPQSHVIQCVRDLPMEPACPLDRDLLNIVEPHFGKVITLKNMQDKTRAYQLFELSHMGEIIRNQVEKRLRGKRHLINADWRTLLDKKLDDKDNKLDEDEERARNEKTAALNELAESRISVLIGPAGTGKTTLLSIICNYPKIAEGEVLLLAPTGKARIKMQQSTEITSYTIAQFLRKYDRYDETTGVYRVSTRDKVDVAKTVIVDEASMLTEEQLGALLDALKGVHRLILVGDPRQLPPIGPGRPFVDIANRLTPPNIDGIFPKVGPGYTELTVRCRQKGDREDLQLADWFSGRNLGPGEDEVLNHIFQDKSTDHIRFVSWDTSAELKVKIIEVLANELKLQGKEDYQGFEQSLGGKQWKDNVYFNPGSAKEVEAWQILSPVRGGLQGVAELNRLTQKTFRHKTISFAQTRYRKIPKLMGPEGIVYGDKVINIKNHARYSVYPKEKALKYVANGEIGIAVGQFKGPKANFKGLPWLLKIEFSSQPGFTYDYKASDFKEEASPILELAYAITVHKAQGSEFGLVLLILPNPCRLLTRELLYTALTRQKDRIVILHQGNRSELLKYSTAYYSETASRLTNLFDAPSMVNIDDRFLEEKLIHRTRRGEPVRSKSEVIIADMLSFKGIEYSYEKKLIGNDGTVKYPDFTIEDDESGITYYWEHLGMLHDKGYAKRWEKKLEWYKDQKILPVEKGGGDNRTIIITKDSNKGGISSKEIEQLINSIFRDN